MARISTPECYLKAQDLLDRTRAADWLAPLLMRAYLVPIFWMAGMQKASHFSDTVDWFGDMMYGLGLPFPWLMAFLATASLGAIWASCAPEFGARSVVDRFGQRRVARIGGAVAAPAYALGGPKLTVRTVRGLLGIPIHHVVNVNFGGFQRAVNRLGCVYADIDRRYFNDNNPPNGGGPDYATIDVEAGFVELAEEHADFRHHGGHLLQQHQVERRDDAGEALQAFAVGRAFECVLQVVEAALQALGVALLEAAEGQQHQRLEVEHLRADAQRRGAVDRPRARWTGRCQRCRRWARRCRWELRRAPTGLTLAASCSMDLPVARRVTKRAFARATTRPRDAHDPA